MGPEKEPSIGAVCCRDRDFYFILFLIVQVVGAERMGFKKKKKPPLRVRVRESYEHIW